MTIKLLLKTHNITGLKYLCMTRKADWVAYPGSGKLWKRHLAKHGTNVSTQLLYETENLQDFKTKSREFSEKWNVVNDSSWANLRPEEGDGGDTVSKLIWITNGQSDKYHPHSEPIPEGWRRGRNKCIFNDKEKQREFNRINHTKRSKEQKSLSMKRAWKEGRVVRDNTKLGRKGDANVAKRPEVKSKISQARKKPCKIRGIEFNSRTEAAAHFGVTAATISVWVKQGI